MFSSNVYDNLNILDKAADAAWLRNEAIANNIANVDTPNYKRQDVTFETELQRAMSGSNSMSISEKIDGVDIDRIEIRTYSDYDELSYRLDGNNVDIDTENVILAKNQLKYEALMDSISGEFTSLQVAMGK
ncbi:MAG: flagellar basal body rod protein FlgB [Eubacteriales bacterium]